MYRVVWRLFTSMYTMPWSSMVSMESRVKARDKGWQDHRLLLQLGCNRYLLQYLRPGIYMWG